MPICPQLEYLNESGARGSHVSKLHRYSWVVVATNLKVIAIALLSIPIVNVYFFGEIEKMTTSTLMKKLSMATVGAAVVALGAVDSAQAFGFTGAYAPSNWTLSNNNTNGYVDTSNAPSSISIIGGEEGGSGSGQTTYTTTALIGGLLSFNWSYGTADWNPSYDPFGFVLNGAFTQLTNIWGRMGSQVLLVPHLHKAISSALELILLTTSGFRKCDDLRLRCPSPRACFYTWYVNRCRCNAQAQATTESERKSIG
jgi:hypothetical protein